MQPFARTSPELELAYLALLTHEGLKPMSRWEGPFDPATEARLLAMGLRTRVVERRASSGRQVPELLFARSTACLDAYARGWDQTPLERNQAAARLEGLWFGYPSCCVENYVHQGYAPNGLPDADQSLLFHWACPHCRLTSLLLPHYRRIHEAARQLGRPGPAPRIPGRHRRVHSQAPQKAITLAAVLAASLPATIPALGSPPSHQISLASELDPDGDLLTTTEETVLGTDPARPDQDANAVPDGADLALVHAAKLQALPTEPATAHPYVLHHMAYGLEQCKVCGELINMGSMEVVNPLEQQSIHVPYVADHFLAHGSFSYAGSVHAGRVNAALLNIVLTSTGRAHFTPEDPQTDVDQDGLRQDEEEVLGTRPQEPDTDTDGVLDGPDLGRQWRTQLDALPRAGTPESGPEDRTFVVEHPMDGIEVCPHCGDSVVMDVWDVINPVAQLSISIPSMALHHLEHGGFRWEGGQLHGGAGRVDPRQLHAVLTGIGNGHWLPVTPDQDADGLTDDEERELKSLPDNPDENTNHVPDGVDLARSTAAEIDALPTQSDPAHVYRLDYLLRGMERCRICGENVNMGHLVVCNLPAQLFIDVPYIALHALQHGSFSSSGNLRGQNRLDVGLLQEALHSPGPGHVLKIPNDADADGLQDREEKRLGTDPSASSSHTAGVPDGFELARSLAQAVQDLSRSGSADPCAIHHLLRGLVTCPVCGIQENMGYVAIHNRKENVVLDIPYLALHFMRHGSFAYGDNERVNPLLLDIALRFSGDSHWTQFSPDADTDGLLDAEEPALGTLPDQADSDGDQVPDGPDLAAQFHERIQALPKLPSPDLTYRTDYEANGFEPCPVCGTEINCGHVIVTNPWAGLSAQATYLQLHFMERGSFGPSVDNRADPVQVQAVLRPSINLAVAQDAATLTWIGQTGRHYQVFLATDIAGPWTPGPVFVGNGSPQTFSDTSTAGPNTRFYKIAAW